MRRTVALALLFLLMAVAGWGQYPYLSDLVLNYSDFSTINSIAVGYEFVYFGTSRGVTCYNITNDRWADPLTGIEGLRGTEIFEVRAARNDETVWVRTEAGYYQFIRAFNRWERIEEFPEEEYYGTHLRPDFDYFAPSGYNYFNTGFLTDFSGNEFYLTDILADNWSKIWIGTNGLGALRAGQNDRRMELLTFGLLQEDVTTIFNDDGLLWMGGTDWGFGRTGLTVFDWRENNFEHIETSTAIHPIRDNINDIYADARTIYLAGDNGVFMISQDDYTIDDRLYRAAGLPGPEILSICAVGDTLYIGGENGLGVINLAADSGSHDVRIYLQPLAINSLEKIGRYLWIGTSDGVHRLNLDNGSLGRMKSVHYASYGEIRDFAHDGQKIWIAAVDELVAIDTATAKIDVFPEVMQYGGARAIAVKDTLVACATPSGLWLLYNGQKIRHKLYTTADGLPSNDIRDLVIDGEYIWLGSNLGLTRFWYKNPSLY